MALDSSVTNINDGSNATPFLKWAGGKRWFVAKHAGVFPTRYGRYIEPFLGSGAVFFWLQPRWALLGDLNGDLISLYQGIRDDWMGVHRSLQFHQSRHDKRYYYTVRDMKTRSVAKSAARMIYLNRTSYNGIYRVNRGGKFNVPKGTRNRVVFNTDDFAAVSILLAGAELRTSDFQPLIDEACRGDLIFADPPYTVRHNRNAFIRYNEALFSWEDQIRLANSLTEARDRGVKVVATNANHRSLRKIYRDRCFEVRAIWRFSCMSADVGYRRKCDELLVLGNCDKESE